MFDILPPILTLLRAAVLRLNPGFYGLLSATDKAFGHGLRGLNFSSEGHERNSPLVQLN